MVRNKILIILTLAVSSYIFSIEPTFIVTEDSPVWQRGVFFLKKSNSAGFIGTNELVQGIRTPTGIGIDKIDTYISTIKYKGSEFLIESSVLLPTNTESYFNKDLLVDINDPDRKVWVISSFLDVFSSRNRREYLKYESEYLKNLKEWNAQEEYGSQDWWDEVRIYEGIKFFNTSISIGKRMIWDFLIHNIKQLDKGYIVTVQGDSKYVNHSEDVNKLLDNPFPSYLDRETFDLIFQFDGEYCDVYVDSIDNFFATFALVEPVFLDEFEDLIHNGMCNYKRVQEWPKRADGSMDFPPVDPSKIGP